MLALRSRLERSKEDNRTKDVLYATSNGKLGDAGYFDCETDNDHFLYSSPSASQQFEGRGADELNNTLTLALERLFCGPQSGLDLEKLCIIPGQQCWVIYIDAMVIDCAGNLLDCVVMTARAALFDTRIPKTEIHDVGDGEYEFEVVDDVEDADPVVGWDLSPVSVTLYKV